MKFMTIVLLVLFCAQLVCVAQAEIYSWTDENGVKHYSHTPPTDQSVPVKSAPEIQSGSTASQTQEILNEADVEAVLKQMEQAKTAPSPKMVAPPKPLSRQERIAAEAANLQEMIAWLEQLPPEAYANTRSKQAIIGRYRYRLTQLQTDPDAYFRTYGY